MLESTKIIPSILLMLLFLILLDSVLFGVFYIIHNPEKISSMYPWKYSLMVIFMKCIFGYYVYLFLYLFYKQETYKEFLLFPSLSIVFVSFFLALTLMVLTGKWASLSIGYHELLTQNLKFPLGNEFYIAIVTSLISPIILKIVTKT